MWLPMIRCVAKDKMQLIWYRTVFNDIDMKTDIPLLIDIPMISAIFSYKEILEKTTTPIDTKDIEIRLRTPIIF